MKTGSWYTTKGMAGRIGISVGTPRGIPGPYRLFKPLNPTRDMLHLPPEEYGPLYDEILARLDPRATWDELHRLAGGAEPILLCHERPPWTANNRCHRRRVAEWFRETLGEVVDELEVQPAML